MAGIGDSLAQLGQQVGATLAQKEQQKQAQAMLPYLQQSMQESMKLAQDGDTAGAYSNMMGVFASNPNLMQNQAVLPFLTMGLKGIDESATRYKQNQEYDQRQAYYDKVTAGKTGTKTGTGSSFSERFNQARGRGGSQIVDVLLPGETGVEPDFNQPNDMPVTQTGVPAIQSNAPQGTSFGAGAYQPSEQTIQQFAENSNKYDAAKPKQKKELEAQRTIVYDNQDSLGRDIGNLDNDQFGFTQVVAGAADPTLFGIQFARFKQGDVNAKGEPTYKPNDDANASIGRLQEALNLVNDRPELKDIYTKAGGWKNIELKPTPTKKATKGQRYDIPGSFEVINKKNPSEKVEITQDEFSLLGAIGKIIPTSQTNDMKIIRVGEDKEVSGKTVEDKYPVKKTEPTGNAEPTPTPAPTPAKRELTLEEQVQQELSGAKQTVKTVTPQQAKSVEQSKISSQKSNLESEKRKLENLIYTVQRASGGKTLKAGITKETEAKVKAEVDKINKQLASL